MLEGENDTTVDVMVASNDYNVAALNYLGDSIKPYGLPLFNELTSPIIGDIDGDKKSETVIATADGYVHVWENKESHIPDYLLEWPQFHHDQQRTGVYNWTPGMMGGKAEPNTFSSSTMIPFALRRTQHTRVRVYNNRGRLVKTLVNQILPRGTYHPVWDGTDDKFALLPNGLYFIDFKVNTGRKVTPVRIMR